MVYATCPTYVLTGDERDSPRGRIWMMRDLLGGGDKQTEIKPADVSYHLDRCLTCLSCMTTCPSGVDYMHLVDIGRARCKNTRDSQNDQDSFVHNSAFCAALSLHCGLRVL